MDTPPQQDTKLVKFLTAMQSIYGPFETLGQDTIASWTPLSMTGSHKGRYLWTDGFAVVNFLTLFKVTEDTRYIAIARRLVQRVHSILGYTRDGKTRLPGATDDEPLKGGLRIGKLDEEGDDGDGQYFHYLTVWMFALNRMTLVTGENWYNQQAISMADAVLPKFMIDWDAERPRMFWKLSMDLSHPLVLSEGNLDPIDGYVTYKLLQATSGDASTLEREIAALQKCVTTKWKGYTSSDALDIGMTLWTAHWLRDSEEWASELFQTATSCLEIIVVGGYFQKSLDRRLAFREFGTALGVQCLDAGNGALLNLADEICKQWEDHGIVPRPLEELSDDLMDLMPITAVMYATALIPGVMIEF